ncbi:hypothetical protein PanWU01x14_159550 [Parasponia andersonii]|uniref:Uncharacterized protein n=1 Tax=Parasponia andersonii TaxID=3476 RepID=A0A2P5CEM4_PARAD|nr:hypothetical protein PanWU01x14_159550 [Parasponia andersonii]
MENIRFHREDIEPDEVDNIDDLICQTCVVIPNDFLVDDDEFENDTLEEYNDEEVELDDNSDTSSEEKNGIFDNKLSIQNSKNRSKQLYSPVHGSSTMTSKMKANGNPETGELMNPIDYFKSRHLKPSGWRNEYTQEKHGRIHSSRAQSELGDGVSSAESMKGLEALPRLKSIDGQRAASTRQVTETIATLKQQLAEKYAEYARQIDET